MATASFASSVGLEFKVAQTAKVPRENPINPGLYQTRSRYEKGVVAPHRSFPLALNRVKSKASASVCLGHESNKCVSHGEREKLGNESEKGRESAKARKEGLALGGGRNRRRFLTPTERASERGKLVLAIIAFASPFRDPPQLCPRTLPRSHSLVPVFVGSHSMC